MFPKKKPEQTKGQKEVQAEIDDLVERMDTGILETIAMLEKSKVPQEYIAKMSIGIQMAGLKKHKHYIENHQKGGVVDSRENMIRN